MEVITNSPKALISVPKLPGEAQLIVLAEDADVSGKIEEFLGGAGNDFAVDPGLNLLGVYRAVKRGGNRVFLLSTLDDADAIREEIIQINLENKMIVAMQDMGLLPPSDENGCYCGQCSFDDEELERTVH